MKLTKFELKNFRGYQNATIDFSNFSTIVGINDSGKSTIFEALDIFFDNTKFDGSDRNIKHLDQSVELIAHFKDLPDEITIESVKTNMKSEFLTCDNEFVLKKVFTSDSAKFSEFVVADMPDVDDIEKIHSLKIKDLRKKVSELGITLENVDQRVSSELRQTIFQELQKVNPLAVKEIELRSEDGKWISQELHKELPLYQLFKADRENSDGDNEVQDPIKAIVKSTLSTNTDLQDKLATVFEEVKSEVTKTTDATLNLLKSMNTELANSLNAEFASPKWETLFKPSLKTDESIPLNKRGSGVRRLVLLNFFRAEAQRRFSQISDNKVGNIIYAFEEPETALHPKFQRILLDSFEDMVSTPGVQIMITTHSPEIAKSVPKNGISLVKRDEIGNAHICSGQEAVSNIVHQLGLLPDIKLYADQLSVLVVLEGPTDVQYFERAFEQLSSKSAEERQRVAFMFGGGNAIVESLNSNYIRQLNLDKKIVIVDGDQSGQDDLLNMGDDVFKLQLKKSTIEFYLPFDHIQNIVSQSNQLELTCSFADWQTGADYSKLSRGVKRFLKQSNAYSNYDIRDLPQKELAEVTDLVTTIDSFI
ncbi:ATP-binding protein [Leuconostoc mesenteroides]|uniref:ATP-binding protein n=1 Tax=Leuconostoc mesenteroides TaxID=1245 RepID=UPI00374A65BD